MGERFVDLSYRGLELGRRLKLYDFRADAGYVEMPLPMPVGTRVEIATDDGMRIDAVVAAVHEQVAGSDRPPGMRLKPDLLGQAADWWGSQVDRAAVAREEAQTRRRRESQAAIAAEVAAAQAALAEKETGAGEGTAPLVPAKAVAGVIDTPRPEIARSTLVMSAEAVEAAMVAGDAVEGYVDDGRRTEAMPAIDPDALAAAAAQDETKSTTVMDAIDISMITGEPPADVGTTEAEDAEITIEPEDGEGDSDSDSSGEISTEMPTTPSGATPSNGKRKRGKRRKKRSTGR